MSKQGYIYIMTCQSNSTVYIGVTSDLIRRVYEHKNGITKGFTTHYKLHKLVYFEQAETIEVAIAREKQLKNWRREWKNNLIHAMNPQWKDLYPELLG